jgi:hypothetical protein
MLIDKIRCEPVLRYRSIPFWTPVGIAPADRSLFDALRRRPCACTGEATSFYTIQPSDANHRGRMELINAHLASQGGATASIAPAAR